MRKQLGRLLQSRKMKSETGIASAASRTSFTHEMLEQYERSGPDPNFSHVYRIDEHTVVKFGDGVRMAEAASMRLVREKTSIPVPEVLDAYVQDGNKYGCIVMEYVSGRRLDEVWESYNETQKADIILQLRQYFDELRSISGSFRGKRGRYLLRGPIFQ